MHIYSIIHLLLCNARLPLAARLRREDAVVEGVNRSTEGCQQCALHLRVIHMYKSDIYSVLCTHNILSDVFGVMFF